MLVTVWLLVSTAFLLIIIASQLFWIRRIRELGGRLITSRAWRCGLGWTAAWVYFFMGAYNAYILGWAGGSPTPTNLTLQAALLEVPFRWWVASSSLGFAVAALFGIGDRTVRGALWACSKVRKVIVPDAASPARSRGLQPSGEAADDPLPSDPPSPSRRRFLEQTAIAVSAAPFVAGAYGLLYGRLNLETPSQRIKLRRLPKAFDGFRIAQLSDIHISQYMSAEEIRRFVGITNELKPDLVALTGDYITWDPATQAPVVEALAGLKAPFGVFGCLGNHENYAEVQNSITRLFAAQGIRILRGEGVPLQTSGEILNLLGVDFQSRTRMGSHGGRVVRQYLEGMERLVMPDTANLLLSHNPNSFDRAAELGIDLSLAGHTHGGQVTLEFIHPSLSPSRLITPFVRGWFAKPGGQLYVNRGLGTIGVPMRLGSPPEITVLELVREG